MAMAFPGGAVRQPAVTDERITDRSSTSFSIEFRVSDHVLDYLWGGNRPLQPGQRRERLVVEISFLLRDQISAFPQLSMSLASLGIPVRFHHVLVREIRIYAASLVNDTFNASRRVIPVRVSIYLSRLIFEVRAVEEDEDSDIMDEDEIDHQWGGKACVEGMKKVRFEGGGTQYFANNTECMICLEEFEMGAEVTEMPCSHLFHSHCCLEWLQRSHVCPLCRHEMPRSMPS